MTNLLIPDLIPNTQYVLEVRAVRTNGVSEWSNRKFFTTVSDTVLPLTPVNITWAVSGDGFAGSWDTTSLNVNGEVISIVRYEVELVANSLTRIISVNQTTAGTIYYNLSFEDNRQLFGSPQPTVQMRVRSVSNIDTKSAWSAPLSASNPVPGNPTSVVATAGPNQIGLTWVAPSDTDLIGYNVYFGGTKVTFVNATSWIYYTSGYVSTSLTVKSVDKFNQESTGAASNSVTPLNPSTVDTTAPNTPTGLTGSITNNANGIGAIAAVSWTMSSPPSDLAGYYVRYRRVGDTNYQTVTFAKDALAGNIELNSAYTNYEFQIKAFDWTNNESAWSSTLTVTSPSNSAPANVTGLSSTAGKDSITYSWTPVADTDIKNYEVTFSISPTFASGNITYLTGNSTSLTVGGLTTNTTYYARVRAVDTGGNPSSAWSSTDTRTTGVFPTANSIILTSTTQVLTSPSGGGATTPATATVTGTATGTTITTYDYSVDGAAFSTSVPTGVSRTGNVVTITGSTMTARTIAVRMGDGSISDTLTVAKNFDGATGSTGGTGPAGADAYTVLLTNEAQTIAAGTTNALAGSFTTNVNAYKGSTAQTVTVGTITGGATGITAAITNNNTTNPLITFTVTTALTTANGSFNIPVTVAGITFTQIWTWSLSFTGAQGSTGPTGPSSDGIIPAAASAPSVIGRLNSLYVVWSPVTLNNSGGAQNDPVTYEVHLSTTTGFTPSGATKVTEVSGTSAMISNLPGTTTALSYGTTYYIKIIAKDRDGSAAASTQGSGQISKVASTDVTSIGADLIVPGTGFVNALVVNTGGSIQSSNYVAATSGWKIAPTGIEMNDNGSTIKADAIKAGTLGGSGGSGVIQIAAGTSLVLNGGYLKSNTYSGTSYNSGATAGFYLGNDGLVIAQGTIKAEAFAGGTFTAGTITMGAGGSISGGSWTLNSSGLTIPNGAISAASLNIQIGQNLMPAKWADFEYASALYPATIAPSGTSSIVTNQVYNNAQSLKIINASGTSINVWFGESSGDYNIKLAPNTRYILSGYVYNATGSAINGFFFLGESVGPVYLYESPTMTITGTAGWVRYSSVVTTDANASLGILGFQITNNSTLYFDSMQVEKAFNSTVTTPSPWSPPGSTLIDGAMIRTGSIQSTALGSVWDTATNGYITGTQPAWSINTAGGATFANLNVNGSVIVGDPSDVANAAKHVIGSVSYVPGQFGWIMHGDGWVEFNQITANTISGAAIKAGTLSVDKLASGTLGVDIKVVGGGGFSIYSGTDTSVPAAIQLNPTVGLIIDPPGDGKITIPIDGTDIKIENVQLSATKASFAGNVSIYGTSNYLSGDLVMEKSISTPTIQPTVDYAWTDSSTFIQAGVPGGWQTFGLGNHQTAGYWITAIWNGVNDARLWYINQTTGAMAQQISNPTIQRVASQAGYYSQYIQANPDLVRGVGRVNVGGTYYYAMLLHYPAQSGTVTTGPSNGANARYDMPYSFAAEWRVSLWTNANTNGAAPNITWAPAAVGNLMSLTTDDTYIYIGYNYSTSPNAFQINRYDYNGANGITAASSTSGYNTDVTCVYVGAANFGSTRYLIGGSGNAIYSLTGVGVANDSATTFDKANYENAWGLIWDGTNFRSITLGGKIYKYSNYTGTDNVSANWTYAWYDTDNTSTGGIYNPDRGNYKHMTLPSPPTALPYKRRWWTKVSISSSIPDSGGIDDPDSIKIFANGIPQPDWTPGQKSNIYTSYVTSTPVGEIIPTRNEFDDISKVGSFSSKASDLRNSVQVPRLQFKGDGTWFMYNLVGIVLPYAGTTAPPDGFLLCDGRAVSRTTYASLFAVISTQYGAGDGSTTFNLPNLVGRVPVGYNASDADFNSLGRLGGDKNLQAHSHSEGAHTHSGNLRYTTNTSTTAGGAFRVTDIMDVLGQTNSIVGWNTGSGQGGGTGTAGSGGSQNLQPYTVLNYIIKY